MADAHTHMYTHTHTHAHIHTDIHTYIHTNVIKVAYVRFAMVMASAHFQVKPGQLGVKYTGVGKFLRFSTEIAV